MKKRVVTQREAADILGAWADVSIRPLCTPTSDAPDLSLDDTCDEVLRLIADDPDADFSMIPRAILLLAWRRVLWGVAAATLEPNRPMLTIAEHTSDRLLLQMLIGGLLAGSRFPGDQPGPAETPTASGSPPGSKRLH